MRSQEILSKELRKLWIIWWAMLGALVFYLFLCLQFEDTLRQPQGEDFPLDVLKNALLAVAVIEILFISTFSPDSGLTT